MFTNKKRIFSILIFALVLALLACAMIGCGDTTEVEHDHDGDGIADHTASEHKTLWDKWVIWCSTTEGQIWGFSLAGVFLAAAIVFIVLWIPKKTDKKEKKAVTKKKDN